MAVVAAAMADQLPDSRVARLESDVTHIRSDIQDVKRDIRELRKELTGMREEIWRLERKLVQGLASNRIWMLLQSAALLGVMARGFKWI